MQKAKSTKRCAVKGLKINGLKKKQGEFNNLRQLVLYCPQGSPAGLQGAVKRNM